jgi:hypothetical protein
MTLILAMSTPNAICMSADYRVTNSNDGNVLDPFAIKSLIVKTSMDSTGPQAIITFTGLAELWGRMPMGRWLRETLRGQSQSFDDLMQHLLGQLNRKIAGFNRPLIVNVLVISGPNGERRHWGGFSNTTDFRTAVPKFGYFLNEIGDRCYFGNGSGAQAVQADGYAKMMKDHVTKSDQTATDHMNLLAKINRDVAEADPDGPVSPYSYVTCISSDNDWVPTSQAFHKPGETPPPFHLPMITCGIDASNLAEQAVRKGRAARSGAEPPPLDEDELRRHVDRRP